MLKTLVVHDQHDQVHSFNPDLQSPASTADRDECGRAPTFRCTAGGDATSVLAANNESAFNQVWHHQDAFGTAQHFFRDPFVGRSHDGVQHVDRFLQAVNRVFPSRTCPCVSSNQTY